MISFKKADIINHEDTESINILSLIFLFTEKKN